MDEYRIEDDFSIELDIPEAPKEYVAVKKVTHSQLDVRLLPGDDVPVELAKLEATMKHLLAKGAVKLKE